MPKSAPPARPPITTNTLELANLAASFLAGQRDPVTAATITSGLGMTDYPTMVICALNRLRLDGRVECEKRRPAGKNKNMEWHYWLSALPVAQPHADSADLAAITAERDELASRVRSLTQRLSAAQRAPAEAELAEQLSAANEKLAAAELAAGKIPTLEAQLREWQHSTGCESPLAAAQKATALNSRITELETQRLDAAVGRSAEIERQWQAATGAASPEAAQVFIRAMLHNAAGPESTTPAPTPRNNRPKPVEIIGVRLHGNNMMLQFSRRLNAASASVPRGQIEAAMQLGAR
ncbi:hypothetical protein [Rivihabitans pingtungensis]|uniref:hypothetical protein n=1 Tax=Rivihabitans pingtungensis TaxID=1054498 RepID=UPI002353DADE|nr:hypothetical protein [Rivihabitans pingtungensis]MCK6435998.1 hypothetical protein [Rivihabitans pingtungensis]